MEAGVLLSRVAVSRPRILERWPVWSSVAAVTVLAAVLRLVSFARVRNNPFYDAAVRSMGQSWHNFFYGAYEPSGQVSIDKTPVDLWLQVASTKLLGYGPVAVRIPEVIAGIVAVPLLYGVVRRLFGHRAGLLAAGALAVLPIAVVTARSDTMDSVMMALVVGAAWLIVRAGETGRTAPLIGAGAVLGLAFEVKLFEALIAVPALLVLAFAVLDLPVRARLVRLAGAGLAFAVVSLAWLVGASLGPGPHPYPIGSTNGSVWNVVFGFNGVGRLHTPASAAQAALDPAGPLRLFTTTGVLHGRLIGSALIAALVLGAAALGQGLWARAHDPPPEAGAAPAEARLRRAGVWLLGVWLVGGTLVFSQMARLHPRYLEAFSPAVAATIGVSVAALAAGARRHRSAGALLAGAALAIALLGPLVDKTPTVAPQIAIGAAAAAALVAAAVRRPSARSTIALATAGAVAVLAVPTAAAVHLARRGASSAGTPTSVPASQTAALSRYLLPRQGTARYEVASSTVAKAGPLIVRDGRPVLMLTSLYGRPLLSPAQLAAKVRSGQVRFVMLGRGTCSRNRHCAPVVAWAREHTRDVSRDAGLRAGTLSQFRRR